MPKVPIDLILLFRPLSTYRFEAVAQRLTEQSLPHFFSLLPAGGPVWQSEVLLAALGTPGVRRARIVRLSRSGDVGGEPPEKLEFSPDEIPTLGELVVDLDPEATRSPFA